jgi:hypothetical protein
MPSYRVSEWDQFCSHLVPVIYDATGGNEVAQHVLYR